MENFEHLNNIFFNSTHFQFLNPANTSGTILQNSNNQGPIWSDSLSNLTNVIVPRVPPQSFDNINFSTKIEDLDIRQRRRAIDDAVQYAVSTMAGWSQRAIARSAHMTVIGSVFVSVLVGLLLWVGILQYLGVIKKPNRRELFLEQQDMLETIADKVVRDLAAYSKKNEMHYSSYDYQNIPIPFPVSVKNIPVPVDVHNPFEGNLLDEHFAFPIVPPRRQGVDLSHSIIGVSRNQNRLIFFRNDPPIPLKPFNPSPVDDVISTFAMPPVYRQSRPLKRKITRPLYNIRSAKSKPINNQRKKARLQRIPVASRENKSNYQPKRIIGIKPAEVDRPVYTSRESSKYQGRGLARLKSGRSVDPFFYSKNWMNVDQISNGEQKYIEEYQANDLSSSNYHKVHPTNSPVRVTTFRSNRRNNFMDFISDDPYEVERYFPNLFQPMNLYENDDHEFSFDDQEISASSHIRQEVMKHIRDLYGSMIQDKYAADQETVSEYLDPTSFVTDRSISIFDQKNYEDRDHFTLISPPIKSYNNVLQSFNHRYANVSSETPSMNFDDFQDSDKQYTSIISDENKSNLDSLASENKLHDVNHDNDQNGSTNIEIEMTKTALRDEKTFQKVKGISDELLMALFPDYMKKNMLNKHTDHNYKD